LTAVRISETEEEAGVPEGERQEEEELLMNKYSVSCTH
jgi:hypothetical protein